MANIASAMPKTRAEVPAADHAQALEAVSHYGLREHTYSDCFVCGPRARGDGMRIRRRLRVGLVAAAWLPDRSLADRTGGAAGVRAALDGPGFARARCGVLLGLYAARIDRCVHVDAPCVVIGWPLAHEGRKHRVGTAIFDGFGELCGRAIATWVEPRQP
jgi:hypothetical protein